MVDTANTAAESHDSKPLRVGLDIGSTTVKAVVLDQTNALNDVLFSDYRRHHANVRATVAGLLKDIHQTLVDLGRGDEPIRLAITGSGGLTLADNLHVRFIQEVIAESGYDPARDLDNTPDSVFCAHGAGTVIPWDRVRDYMHIDTGFGKAETQTPPPAPRMFRRRFDLDTSHGTPCLSRNVQAVWTN